MRTDIQYLLEGGFWLSLGQAISSFAAFFIAIAYANALSQDAYGIYKYIISIAGVLTAFSAPGMNAAITRSVARGMGGSLSLGTWWRVGAGVMSSLLSLGIACYYYVNGNITLALGALVIAALLPLFDAFTTASAYLQGKKDFRADAWYSNIVRIGSAIALIGAVFLTHDIIVLIIVHFLSYTILRGFVYWRVLTKKAAEEPVDPDMVRYGWHLTLMNFLHLGAAQIDKILLFQFLGAAELAIYSIAVALPDHIRGLVRNTEYLAAPKFAQLEEARVHETLRELWRKMAIFGSLIACGVVAYYFFAPLFFNVLFPQYDESIPFSQLYAVTIILAVLTLPTAILRYQARTKELYIINIASDVLQIVLLFTCIWFFGIWGAVWARIAGTALTATASIGFVAFTYRKPASADM